LVLANEKTGSVNLTRNRAKKWPCDYKNLRVISDRVFTSNGFG